jgi:hypothetical protein
VADCPECGEELVRGTFCRGCGYDADLSSDEDEAHVEGLDLPTGYAREDEDDEWDHEQSLQREGLKAAPITVWRVIVVLTALACVWVLVKMGVGR